MRISTFTSLSENLLFTLSVGQLYMAVEGLGIDFTNALSPIKKELSAKEPLLEGTKTLMNDKDFIKVLKLLATPDLRVELKGYSTLDGAYASALYIKSGTTDIKGVWVQNDADGQMTLICFKSMESWLDYYLYSKDLSSDFLPSDPIEGAFTKESFLLLLHTFDCYQHAYLYDMINYRSFNGNFILESDFFALLKKGCSASDLRWLIPFSLNCLPWNSKGEVIFGAEHLERLAQLDLLSFSRNEANGESGFVYGANTIYMGLECAAFKKDTFSIKVSDLSNTLLSGMGILTAENLHWFNILNESEIIHHCLDTHSFKQMLLEAIKTLE